MHLNDAEGEAKEIRELSSFTVQLVLGVMRQELRGKGPWPSCCGLLLSGGHDAQQQSLLAATCCWLYCDSRCAAFIPNQGVQHSYQIVPGPCKICTKALSAA